MSWRQAGRGAAVVLGLVLAGELSFRLAPLSRAAVTFDSGPSTGRYVSGFAPSEERLPTTLRWSKSHASIELPLVGPAGPARMALRAARMVDRPTRIHVFVSGASAGSFVADPGGYRLQELSFDHPGGRLRVDMLSEDPELGVALDWLRVKGPAWGLAPEAWKPRSLGVGVFALSLGAGWGVLGAAGAGLVAILACAAFLSIDPFGFVHISADLTVPFLLVGAIVCGLLRGRAGGRWVALVFMAGYLLKGVGIFHPSYFYPDVRSHTRHVGALARAEGSLAERGVTAQVRSKVGVREVAGRERVYPYSPLYYLPFTWLPRQREAVELALKQTTLVAAALEPVVVFWIARILWGPGSGLGAALLAAFLPALYSRLLLALWPTIAGHFLDTLVLAAAAGLAQRPRSRARLAFLAATTFAALATYTSSILSVSAFLMLLAGCDRRVRWRVATVWLGATAVTIAWLYSHFLAELLGSMLPGVLASQAEAGSTSAISTALANQLRRIPLFYGYVLPWVTLAGVVMARKDLAAPAWRVLRAFGLAILVFAGLRVVAYELFIDLKDVEFAGPFVALASGAALEAWWRRGRLGRLAAALIALSSIGFGLYRYHGYLLTHTRLVGL
jgi:hypothetical protein